MQSLQVLSLVRTRLEHEALAAVLGSLTTLTTLKLAWYTSSPNVCSSCYSLEPNSWPTFAVQCHASASVLHSSPVGSFRLRADPGRSCQLILLYTGLHE